MNLGVLRSGLPLLRKELSDQATRKRTYLLRLLYAAVLFLAFLRVLDATVASLSGADMRAALGVGRELFAYIVQVQALGILLVLPAMVAGVITTEKERGSLSLIFLTDLGPWEILLEKLSSRLIPMITFLFLSFPLMAMAYAFGGVTIEGLGKAILLLLLIALEVGSISLWCSTYFRTTVPAFVAAYLISTVVQLFPPGRFLLRGDIAEAPLLSLTGCVMVSIFFLFLSRRDLVTRSSARPRGGLLHLFRSLDEYMDDLNQGLGNFYLIKPRRSLPGEHPITWRELTTKALGQPHYQIRILLAVLIPVVFFLIFSVAMANWRALPELFANTVWLLWGLSILFLGGLGAGAIASERSSQTLDVLLTTPIPSAEIIRQKWLFLERYVWIVWIPLLAVFGIKAWTYLRIYPHAADAARTVFSFTASAAFALVYLRLASWISLWVGLKVKRRLRAVFVTLALLLIWFCLPLVFFWYPLPGRTNPLGFLAPAAMIDWIERYPFNIFFPMFPVFVFVNLGIHLFALRVMRRICLENADAYLGRLPGDRGARPAPVSDQEGGAAAADQPA